MALYKLTHTKLPDPRGPLSNAVLSCLLMGGKMHASAPANAEKRSVHEVHTSVRTSFSYALLLAFLLFPADLSPSLGKSMSGNSPIPFRFMVFQSLLASHNHCLVHVVHCTLHVSRNHCLVHVVHCTLHVSRNHCLVHVVHCTLHVSRNHCLVHVVHCTLTAMQSYVTSHVKLK